MSDAVVVVAAEGETEPSSGEMDQHTQLHASECVRADERHAASEARHAANEERLNALEEQMRWHDDRFRYAEERALQAEVVAEDAAVVAADAALAAEAAAVAAEAVAEETTTEEVSEEVVPASASTELPADVTEAQLREVKRTNKPFWQRGF